MTFATPAGLLWLLSVPVLVWLWRLASTQRQFHIPSLIPFEHLVKRPPRRRSRVVVNRLFWLQLAALLAAALALAQPLWFQRRAKTVLVILDNSASMGARLRGSTAFDRAVGAVGSRLRRKAPADRWLLMTTSPVEPLAREPSSDGDALRRALETARVSQLGGNLSTAQWIGRALLGADPDQTLVVTDEPRPAASDPRVSWVAVGEPLPNVGLVGIDALGPLCAPAPARLIATVQNFSADPASVRVQAIQARRTLASVAVELQPGQRQAVSLALPDQAQGAVEVQLQAKRDALAADNRAWVDLGRRATLPVVVRSQSPAFLRVMSKWLGACQALAWSAEAQAPSGPFVLVTDREDDRATAAATLTFAVPSKPVPVRSQWVAATDHPLGAYLEPLQVVSASLQLSGEAASGAPVVWAIVNGSRWPVVTVQDAGGRRRVVIRLDPAFSDEATPVMLVFFNSLRWLARASGTLTTGSPVPLASFAPGAIAVRRPDGAADRVEVQAGDSAYERTTLAGPYRFEQGQRRETAWVNFFDPLESDLTHRASTWQPQPTAVSTTAPARAPHPLARTLLWLILLLVLAEWWLYTKKGAASSGLPGGMSQASR